MTASVAISPHCDTVITLFVLQSATSRVQKGVSREGRGLFGQGRVRTRLIAEVTGLDRDSDSRGEENVPAVGCFSLLSKCFTVIPSLHASPS